MKNLLFNLFDRTCGKIIRLFQKSLIPSQYQDDSLINLIRKRSVLASADYAEKNMKNAIMFSKRTELWQHCISKSAFIANKEDSWILEFGVWKGESINFIATALPERNLYGFDSFLGLQEDWIGHSLTKNTFSTNGKLPKVEKNVQLIPGWYQDTLPSFLDRTPFHSLALLHLDSDTYSPTKYVLSCLKKFISTGTIIIFDDFFGYPNWESHDFKAWSEFVEENKVEFNYLGFTNNQVGLEILKINM